MPQDAANDMFCCVVNTPWRGSKNLHEHRARRASGHDAKSRQTWTSSPFCALRVVGRRRHQLSQKKTVANQKYLRGCRAAAVPRGSPLHCGIYVPARCLVYFCFYYYFRPERCRKTSWFTPCALCLSSTAHASATEAAVAFIQPRH